jgi:probable blue pigment (indigoidine) exporter
VRRLDWGPMNLLPARSTLATTLLTAVAPLIWGTTYLVATEFLPPDRPLTSAVIRTLPAGLLLILAARRVVPRISGARLVVLSVVNIGAFQALLFVAAQRLPGGLAALVGALQPLLMLALVWAVDRQWPGRAALGAAATGVLGMALLFAAPGAAWDPLGTAAAFLGTACLALGSFLTRRWRNGMPLSGFAGWQLLLGGLGLLPFAVFLEPGLPPLATGHWLGYGYLTLVGTALAYPLWMNGLARLPAVAVSALGLLSPLMAVALGWIFLGQALGLRELAGIAIVLASVGAIQLTPAAPSRQLAAATVRG